MENATTQPIISQLINQYKLRINILQANVEYIKTHAVGIMIIAIEGERSHIQSGMEYLRNIGVETEVMGHVPNDIIPFS